MPARTVSIPSSFWLRMSVITADASFLMNRSAVNVGVLELGLRKSCRQRIDHHETRPELIQLVAIKLLTTDELSERVHKVQVQSDHPK